MTVLLDAQKISMSFGGLRALETVSLESHRGQITGLIGPNGAGKSTMFNCLSGLLTPSSGEVVFEGQTVTRLSAARRARLGMGRTFQHLETFRDMTVRENLLVAAEADRPFLSVVSEVLRLPTARAREARARAKVDDILDLLDLGAMADRAVGDLPLGSERTVELGRALAADAKLLLLDEPSSGLDHRETQDFGELLTRILSDLGISIFLVEHDIELVMRICDVIYVLDSGRLIATGTPESVRSDPVVIAAYLGQEAASLA